LRLSGYQLYPEYRNDQHPGWQLMQALIQRFCAAAAGVTPVLIVPIPPFPYYYYELEPRYQPLFERLADPAAGIYVADITTPLLARPREQRRELRFRHDTHFSPQGHQALAEHIAADIVRHRLLPEPRQTATVRLPARRTKSAADGYILGLSCFYHNSAAALIRQGEIVAAAEEERFSRLKNDRRFPQQAINYCLEQAGIHQEDLQAVVYYDNAALTFERLLHSLAAVGEQAEDAWLRILPSWLQYKLHIPALIRRYLHYDGLLLQDNHHRAHAASAFYPAPFERAAILTVDGVGEWATAAIARADGSDITLLKEMRFPHSLGLL
jgi:carbamoyltransferase